MAVPDIDGPERMANTGPMAVRAWAPQVGLVVLGWVAAGLTAGWLLLTEDAGARLFAAVALVAVLAIALAGTVARPRLAAGPDGIAVRGLRGTRRWPWPAVRRLAVVRTRRLGRDVPALEIDVRPVADHDADEQLLMFTRLDLGAEPDDVADQLIALRPEHRAN